MKSAAALVAAALALAGCSSVRVTTDWDRAADFSALRSFAWMERASGDPDPFGGNTLVGKRVTAAVERELEGKGLRRADGAASFLIAVHTSSRDRLDVTTWPSWGYGWGRRRVWGAWSHDRVEVSQWTEGTLVLDFVDPASKELIWRGVASAAIDASSGSPERVDAAVHELLEQFPPSGK